MEGRAGQRHPAVGNEMPADTCAPNLFSQFDNLPDIDVDAVWGPVRFFLGWGPKGPGDFRPNQWVANIKARFGGKRDDSRWVYWPKEVLVSLFLGAAWCAAVAAEIWIMRPGPPGGCKNAGVRTVKADIQAKELIALGLKKSAEAQTKVDYLALNYFCPHLILDVGATVDAYLAAEIDGRSLHDYGRANDVCDQSMDIMAQSRQHRTSEDDLWRLRVRDQIPEHEYRLEMRRLGWLSDAYVSYHDQAREWWPSNQQVVDWMRHGIVSNDAVQTLRLDDGFDAAMGDRPTKWLKGTDTSPEMARYLWRSGFRVPDVAALLPWYYRSAAGELQGDAAITDDDLRAAIQYSDLAPRFRAAAFEARWQRIGVRMLRGAYDEGIIDESGVMSRMVQEGIHPDDAQVLMMEWAKLKPAYCRRKIGAGGAAAFGKAFAAGELGTRELVAELNAEGFTASEIKAAVQEARAERQRHMRAELIRSLHKRYLAGEVNDVKVQAVLHSTGLDAEDIDVLLHFWREEFEMHPRHVSASQLCGWYRQGLMRETEFTEYLAQLRYSPEDAARIIAACDLGSQAAKLKTAEGLVNRAEKSLTRDQREWASAIRRAEKIHGAVERRTVTQPGRLLRWIETRVLKRPKQVSEKGPPTNGEAAITQVLSPEAEAAAAAFVEDGSSRVEEAGGGVAPEGEAVPPTTDELPQPPPG